MSQKKSAANGVFDALLSLISSYEYAPGDRLPSENAIAEEYGVSRVTVRSALNQLSALGCIESRVGGGWYVKKFQFSCITDITSKFMITNVSEKDIREYRLLIEIASINHLKNTKINSTDIKYLENCCDRILKLKDSDDISRKLAIADYDFHRRICKMSKNKLYLYSYDMLYSLIIEYFENRLNDERIQENIDIDAIVKGHKRIIENIVSGDIPKAIECVEQMAVSEPDEYLSFINILEDE